jgi:dienelactone hydrolase
MMVGGAVLVIVLTALATLVVPVPVTAQTSGPILRLEIHPLESRTLSEEEFLTGARAGAPAVIAAELRLPRPTGRLPVVVLLHGSSGVRANVDRWAREINEIGVAALVVDSFTGRGIARTATDQAQLDSVVMIVDAYRALELLARHPRIDPARIALMGFSKGGFATLYASVKRFQRIHGPRDAEFAAYFAFYGTCQKRFLGDEDVADRPIRLFHGAADDWLPVEPCRRYVARLRKAGKDVALTEYPGALHAFDAHYLPPRLAVPGVQRGPSCDVEERSPGRLVNVRTGQPFSLDDPCIERGATVGYDPEAHQKALKAVKEMLSAVFKLN